MEISVQMSATILNLQMKRKYMTKINVAFGAVIEVSTKKAKVSHIRKRKEFAGLRQSSTELNR
jgi:hypothetical protein